MLDEWLLELDGRELGTLVVRGVDQPWIMCSFQERHGFNQVKSLFDEELLLLNGDSMIEWEQTYNKINSLGLTLKLKPNGPTTTDFILHINGSEAWFRH